MQKVVYCYRLHTHWVFDYASDEYYDTIEECRNNAIEFAQDVIDDYANDTVDMRISFLDIIITRYLIDEYGGILLNECERIPYLRN